jgi:hypothetical protein
MWVILLVAILKNVTVPNGMVITVGDMTPPMYLDYFIKFVGVDMLLLLWAVYAALHTKKIIAYVLVGLSVGKLLDEFVSPYGYSYVEFINDCMVLLFALLYYVYRHLKKDDAKRANNS